MGAIESSGYRILTWSMWRFQIRPSNNPTWNETGPVLSNIVPSICTRDPEKFRTYTRSPTWNALAREWLSWALCCLAWLSCTLPDTSGWSKSSRDLGCLPNNSSAGERPVVVCGVSLYFSKNCDNLVSTIPSSLNLLIPCLKVWTDRSTSPLDAGW